MYIIYLHTKGGIAISKMATFDMYGLEWSTEYGTAADRKHVTELESLFGVVIPAFLKELWTTSDYSFAPTRNGEPANTIVETNPESDEQYLVSGYFHGFDKPTIDRLHPTVCHIRDLYNEQIDLVVPFGLDLDGNLFLNYDELSSDGGPSIWSAYANGDTFDDCWFKVARNFETLLANLKTDAEVNKLIVGSVK